MAPVKSSRRDLVSKWIEGREFLRTDGDVVSLSEENLERLVVVYCSKRQ